MQNKQEEEFKQEINFLSISDLEKRMCVLESWKGSM